MSIYGAMYSGVSGLAAQSNALGVISDNISNVNTVGYKGSRATFQTLVTQATTQTTYTPGGVGSRPLQGVDKQGLLQGTSNATDLSISGNGMFVVNEAIDPDVGDDYMFTRAGEFRPDEQGNLRNAAGFYLQGWPLDDNGNLPPAQQSINSVETVNVSNLTGLPRATDTISLGANLPVRAANDANVFEFAGGTEQQMTVNMFDALGNAHNMTMKFSLQATQR
ncbi:MAG: flagellar hook-basal body complex protein [Rhodovibrio sp.]|nr:flagellar hook-basal body complex protein [Rhodovibrio sp.]